MALLSFKRREKKYLLGQEQLDRLMPELRRHMQLDQHCETGSYEVRDLYMDTDDREIARRCAQKPYYKEKLRLRSYGPLGGDSSPVFLEHKKKIGGEGAKRRAQLTLRQAREFILRHSLPEGTDYMTAEVLREAASMFGRFPGLAPAASIAYTRIAMTGRDDPSLRLTVDRGLTADFGMSGGGRQELLSEGTYLMEIKFSGSVPLWFARAVSRAGAAPVSFSKYGRACDAELRGRLADRPAEVA